MKTILKLSLAILALSFLTVGLMAVIGMTVKKQHIITRYIRVNQSREVIWETITNFAAQPSWRTDLKAVTSQGSQDGKTVWLEEYKDGMAIPLETTVIDSPRFMIRTITDPNLPFAGNWEYKVSPYANGGCIVRITEYGEVKNPVFRFLGHYIFNQAETIETCLKNLSAKFGVQNPKMGTGE
ncbi:MAG: SRPBCC family protein [bacterium]|nr:SRPBCC family protein [bacterium]